jgi:hypothetical protein
LSDEFDVWVGLVEVRPLPDNRMLAGDPGAFANTLSIAADADDFCTRAASFFRSRGFEVASFEAVERLADRALDGSLPEEMRRLGELAGETSEVQFDTYYAYGSTEE